MSNTGRGQQRYDRPLPFFGILSLVLAPLSLLSAALAALTLESFVVRPAVGAFSMSTLLPGVARASVMIVAVSTAAGMVSALAALASGERTRWLPLLSLGATVAIFAWLLYAG